MQNVCRIIAGYMDQRNQPPSGAGAKRRGTVTLDSARLERGMKRALPFLRVPILAGIAVPVCVGAKVSSKGWRSYVRHGGGVVAVKAASRYDEPSDPERAHGQMSPCRARQERGVSGENQSMAGHECYHCKQWVEEGDSHYCWTTTEAALTRDLSNDLHEAWERLRDTAASFGDQHIYASHHSIMFSRETCYFFVRPKKKYLELCVFLGRRLEGPQVRRWVRPRNRSFIT